MKPTRNVAFGYSTRCNIRCAHCVAADEVRDDRKMELDQAQGILAEMAGAGVRGISFTAGEPLLYLDDVVDLLRRCRDYGIYTRIVTNSFWARTEAEADRVVQLLQESGLCQLRLSYSRWHQQHVSRECVLNAARGCRKLGLDAFVSFVTDFSEQDDPYEQFLRDRGLTFFPEPVIYAGRAGAFPRRGIFTDYQANCCPMNPYLSPDLEMYACCDAGSHFANTGFFRLGSLRDTTVGQLLESSERNPLYHAIRTLGITGIASFAGFKAREIVTYRKCELCRELFDSPERLAMLQQAADSDLPGWTR